MITTYTRFVPPRRIAEYVGQKGSEANGQRLSYAAYDALAASKVSGREPEFVVIGEYRRSDGASFLDLGVTRDYIEATTDFRWDAGAKKLRYVCPECEMKDGKHATKCKFR